MNEFCTHTVPKQQKSPLGLHAVPSSEQLEYGGVAGNIEVVLVVLGVVVGTGVMLGVVVVGVVVGVVATNVVLGVVTADEMLGVVVIVVVCSAVVASVLVAVAFLVLLIHLDSDPHPPLDSHSQSPSQSQF